MTNESTEPSVPSDGEIHSRASFPNEDYRQGFLEGLRTLSPAPAAGVEAIIAAAKPITDNVLMMEHFSDQMMKDVQTLSARIPFCQIQALAEALRAAQMGGPFALPK